VQGRSQEYADDIDVGANLLADADSVLFVLDCVTSALAVIITRSIHISSIDIGVGGDNDSLVLVINDILGLTEQPPKFSKNFLLEARDIPGAMQKYVADVKAGVFPGDDNIFV